MGNVPQTGSPYNHVRVRDLKHDRVAVYARVSSDEQAQAGTIENQVDFARRYCDLHGLLIHDFYTDEGVSGALAVDKRPHRRRLLADARAGSAPCGSTASTASPAPPSTCCTPTTCCGRPR